MKRFRNQYTHDPSESPDTYEKVSNKSLTIPDQTLPIQTLVERFTRKQAVPQYEQTFDEDLPDLSKLDQLEKLELARKIRANIAETRQNLQKQQEQPAIVIPDTQE